ncbi:MAG: hypothetical protein WC603_02445 [Candidatus Paceibacterota bacterium]|jgi:hypothetical protein
MEVFFIFITLAGFIIGLGAVTVIDLHGFLGRKSSYWTEATIRTHKITKPLIWIGILLVSIGHIFLAKFEIINAYQLEIRSLIIVLLIVNGIFLSFVVSPALLAQEKEGRQKELLPKILQNKITASFVVSFLGWWGLVYLFAIIFI